MAKKVISIEIGVWWTKVLVMDDVKANATIYEAFYFDTPEHAVEDGFVRDKEVFAAALKTEFAKRHILEKNVIFSINSSKLVTREVSIPYVKDNQIAGIVDMQSKDFFPMNLSNYTISYKKLDTYVKEDGKFVKLLLVAVPDSILENYMEIADMVGLNIKSFEYVGNSAIQMICENFMYNSIVIQLEENTTIVSMISDKQLVFQRVTPYGYINALTAVMDNRVLGVEDDRAAFQFLEEHDIVHIRAKVSEFANGDVYGDELLQQKLDDAYNEIKETYIYYNRIVSTALEYFQNQIKGDFRGRIHVIGDGARFAGIRKFFDDNFPLEADKTDYTEAFKFNKDIVLRYLPRNYGVGLLSVSGVLVNPINILPKTIKENANKSLARKRYFFGLLGAILCSIVLGGIGISKELAAKNKLYEKERERDSLTFIRAIVSERDNAKAEANVYIAFDDATKVGFEDFRMFLEELEKQLPTDSIVSNISLSNTEFSFNVTSATKLSIAQLLMNFKEIEVIDELNLPGSSESSDELGSTEWVYNVSGTFKIAE